jgi:hypothetical protein
MPQEAISSTRSSVKAHTSASARSGEECAPPRPALAGLVESLAQMQTIDHDRFDH